MAYSDDDDLLLQISFADLARLSGDDTGSAIDEARVSEARRNSDALIDTFLSGRYKLPLESVPEIIRTISIDLTVYFLHEYRYRDSLIPTAIIALRVNSERVLSMIQKGDLVLFESNNNPPEIISNKTGYKIFQGNKTNVFFS
jgi:phage gp36-like protein